MQSNSKDIVVGIGWYQRDQYDKLLEAAADRDKLDDSYEAWTASAEKAIQNGVKAGMKMEKVYINVDDLIAWCNEQSLALNGEARAKYVEYQLRRQQ